MPKNCAAVGCTNHNMMTHKKLSFCIFPNKKKQPERWKKWVQALNRVNHDGSDWQPGGKYVYLCSEHFMTGKPSPDPDHPDYLPTVFKNRPAESATSRKFQRPERLFTEEAFQVSPSKFSTTNTSLKDKIMSSDPSHLMLTDPPRKVSGFTQTPTLINNNHKFRNNNNRTMMYDMVDSLKDKVDKVDLKRKIEGFERQLAVSRYESNKCMRPDDDNWIHYTGLDSIIFQTFCALIIAQLFSGDK
ncbi:THAP domain-containing protein 5-like isoform X2 [Portunus trituberculatus]|uniref:THAP domain-containing protein 5-like isoform X2 n=1 Tax=Portunus trituberculatus TaxID=210409 RepID=UPI001E1D1F4E|nr:THAP domain-containing protein 5-like isoform X2 [Portunus trituberculatus]